MSETMSPILRTREAREVLHSGDLSEFAAGNPTSPNYNGPADTNRVPSPNISDYGDESFEEAMKFARKKKAKFAPPKAAVGDKKAAVDRIEDYQETQRLVRRNMGPAPHAYGGLENFDDDDTLHDQATRYEPNAPLDRATPATTRVRENLPPHARRTSKSYFDDDYEDDFVMEASRNSIYKPHRPQYVDPHHYANAQRVQKSTTPGRRITKQAPMFSHEDLVNPRSTISNPLLLHTPVTRRSLPSGRSSLTPFAEERPLLQQSAGSNVSFRGSDEELAPSRYSGAPMPWSINKQPPAVTQKEVSDAALLKRGLKRGKGEKVIKRGYGANDPENIAIVNMKEQEELSFEQITKFLNDQRIRDGRNPTLTICGVNGRYNRTAPLLFSAQGKEFIPLKQRRAIGKSGGDLGENPVFNDETDLILVQCVKDVEAQKWFQVAQLFTERTGLPMNPKSAAIRHGML